TDYLQNRIVEITSDGASISVDRGFLIVKIDEEPSGQVAIRDIAALIIRGHGTSLSANICCRLSDANVPIVICGTNQAPSSVVWPISGHFSQGLHMQAQAVANKPLRKRLWAQLIKAKIEAQAAVLSVYDLNDVDLKAMARRVKSGDSDNIEAQAARRYWPRLMGDDFRRDQHADDVNAALNYGYTILRAACARSILAAGLHPSLSLHHQSRGDALRLADDLMEPFRPWIDQVVCSLIERKANQNVLSLDKKTKRALVGVLLIDMQGPAGASPMQTCIDRLAQSLAQVFLGERGELEMPRPPIPLSQMVSV
ncbi:MAG: type II CRISPR-associated endonuclease Cas1, partial [Hyphomicrobiales bacterium]